MHEVNTRGQQHGNHLEAHGGMGGGVVHSVGVAGGELIGDHLAILRHCWWHRCGDCGQQNGDRNKCLESPLTYS